MKHKVCILLDDVYLKRKLELILSDHAVFTDQASAAVIFSGKALPSSHGRVVTVGRGGEYTLRIPFSDAEVLAVLPSESSDKYGLTVVGDRVFLGDDEIKLTELEGSLFMKLYEARGEFVSRDTLFSVFADGSSESMLNVYIHYLREKLERGSVRVIISSRKSGYKIDEKYFAKGGV